MRSAITCGGVRDGDRDGARDTRDTANTGNYTQIPDNRNPDKAQDSNLKNTRGNRVRMARREVAPDTHLHAIWRSP